jgi:rod shape-determining protein MreC
MQRLLNILRLFKEYVVLALLTIVSLVLLSLNDNPQVRTIRAYTIGAVGMFQDIVSALPNIFALEKENTILRQQNVNLTDEVSRLREARLENTRLREMLRLREHSRHRLIAAEVVGKTTNLLRNTITLNIGERDGVRMHMPVVSEGGLVGRIVAVSNRYAVGQLMINRDFRASVKVQRSRVVGILAWIGGDHLELRNVAKTQDVAVGDVVMTSEYSNVFPRDLKVGVVTSVSEQEGGLFRHILVQPAVDFSTLEHVFIITSVPDAERTELEGKVTR